MKRLITILLSLMLYGANLWSQSVEAKDSVEVSTPYLELIPVGEMGFLMFEYQARNLNQLQAGLLITRYNLDLTKSWDSMIPFDKSLELTHYQITDGRLFIIFSDQKRLHFEIFRLNISDAKGYQRNYSFSTPFYFDALLASGPQTWIAGTMAQQGVLFELDPSDETYQIMPTAYPRLVTSIHAVEFHQQDNVLSYLLKTTNENKACYVFRGFDRTRNRVSYDILIASDQRYNLDQIRTAKQGNHTILTGTYYKKNPETTEGLFSCVVQNGKLINKEFRSFKDIEGFYSFLEISGDETQIRDSRKIPLVAHLDQLVIEDGQLILFTELMEKQYQVKGALQQEFERSNLVNYLDQDQTGRRSFDQADSYAGTSQSAEDRIYQRSGTDILSYRYRNAIIGQPIFRGFDYERTVVFQFDEELKNLTCVGVQASTKQVNFIQIPNSVSEKDHVRQWYDTGEQITSWVYHPGTRSLSDFKQRSYLSGEGRVFHLQGNHYLATALQKDVGRFWLKLQRIIL